MWQLREATLIVERQRGESTAIRVGLKIQINLDSAVEAEKDLDSASHSKLTLP